MKTIKIPELKIEVSAEVLHKGKTYQECMRLKPKDWRMQRINEVVWLANSKYAEKLKMFTGWNDSFFAQPFRLNKEKGLVAGFVACSIRVDLDCSKYPLVPNSALGVRWARDLR